MRDWLKQYSKLAGIFVLGLALIAVYKTFDSFSFLIEKLKVIANAFAPFVTAFVIAYMLNIPCRKLSVLLHCKIKHRFVKKHSYGISIVIVYVLFLLAFAAALWALIPAMAKNVLDIYSNLYVYVESVIKFVEHIEIIEKLNVDLSPERIYKFVSVYFNQEAILRYAQGIITFTSGLLNVFIALIASVYMLLEKDKIIKGIYRLANLFSDKKKIRGFFKHCKSINSIFTQYIYSRLICCVVMGVVCSVILTLMGEKYAILLGVFIGFMDMIPYFGSIISWAVSAVVMAISGGISHSIWCSAVMLIMQQLDGNVLAPKVMGTRLEISPLSIIIAVSVGGTLFGFLGMIISVPIVAIVRAIGIELIDVREHRLEECELSDEDSDGDSAK